MKKILLLLILPFILIGCGNRTHMFTITNQSDWDVVVELKKFKELGKYQEKSNYIIPCQNKVVFEIYNSGSCNLISVNGAKIVRHNSSGMVLSNSDAKEVSVINLTGKNIFLINLPAPPGSLSEIYVKYYKPVFNAVIIESVYNSVLSPKKIFMHAYQLNFEDIQSLPIKIEAQDEFGKRYKTIFQKENNQVQLIIDIPINL